MNKLTLQDLLNIADYEKARRHFREEVIELKKRRRIHLGPLMTLVFENRTTVLFQIQEMARTERLVFDEQLQAELDTYNELLPGPNELSATLLIEITEKEAIQPTLDSLVGLPTDCLTMTIGAHSIPAQFDPAQAEEGRISAVQYIKWQLTEADITNFQSATITINSTHPNYPHTTTLTPDQQTALAKDLG